MNILILSDGRYPTDIHYPGHGLGRQLWRIADGLSKLGHNITLYGGEESSVPNCTVVISSDEDRRAKKLANKTISYDVVLDGTHSFLFSKLRPDVPVVCKVADFEGEAPRNRVYGFPGLQKGLPNAPGKLIHEGIDVDNIPFTAARRKRDITFIGLLSATWKKPEMTVSIALGSGRRCILVGAGGPLNIGESEWHPPKESQELYAFLGTMAANVSYHGATSFLEGAATGTPFLTMHDELDFPEGVVGFFRPELKGAIEATQFFEQLNPFIIREWVADTHNITKQVKLWEQTLQAAANGETW